MSNFALQTIESLFFQLLTWNFKKRKRMKRQFVSLVVLALSAAANAQVAHWLIPPSYDKIYKVKGADLVVTDSLKEKTLWTFDGKPIYKTTDAIFPFNEDVSVITKGGTTAIKGFVTTRGEFTPLEDCIVEHAYPYFSDGLLMVKKKDGYYHFVDKQGRTVIRNCASAFPFSNGYAKCTSYKDRKKKEIRNLLIDRFGNPVKFTYKGKKVDEDDITFISSVNEDNLAVVVVKKKVFYYDTQLQELRPVFVSDSVVNLKYQAQVLDDPTKVKPKKGDLSDIMMYAKCGKKDRVGFKFNSLLVPIEFYVNGVTVPYTQKRGNGWNTDSPIRIVKQDGKFGLYWNGEELLPPQFDENPICFSNKAFVSLKGRYGMLNVIKDGKFSLSMNRGNGVAFRHQRAETTITLDLPSPISTKNASIEVDPESGCEINLSSRQTKDTNFGSSVQYECTLNVPESLSDQMQQVEYEARVLYDGLMSPVIPFTVDEWYYVYYSVNVDDRETTIENGDLHFTFNIVADNSDNYNDYPFNVQVRTDGLPVRLEKLSQRKYKCVVTDLRQGTNTIVIQIQEPGCPSSEYPFDVAYSSPGSRASGGNVVMKTKKKPKQGSNLTVKPVRKSAAKK